jgi:hypothetical protein
MGGVAHPVRVMSRSRFENLEQPHRPVDDRGKDELRRFSRDQPAREEAQAERAPAASATAERFAKTEDQALRLDLRGADTQPFRRCPTCELDSNRFEVACPNCGTMLDTPQAKAFNEALWAHRPKDDPAPPRAEPPAQAVYTRPVDVQPEPGWWLGSALRPRLVRGLTGVAVFGVSLAITSPWIAHGLEGLAGALVLSALGIRWNRWSRDWDD